MAPPDPRTILVAVADRVATQVAAFGDRVAVDRAPQGAGAWTLPYAVVIQTGPAQPARSGDGAVIVDTARIAVAVWQDPTDVTSVVPDTVAALEGWAPAGGRRVGTIGVYRVPQPEDDVLRTEVEVRYAHHR